MTKGTVLKTKSKGEVFFPEVKVNELDLALLRAHVKGCADMLDGLHVSMAIGLDRIFSSGIYQSQWGFSTWREYIKKDVGISESRDSRLRRMVRVFIKWLNVEPEELNKVGYTKLHLLSILASKKFNAIQQSNVGLWMDYAAREDMSYRSLEMAIDLAKAAIAKGHIQKGETIDPPSEVLAASYSVKKQIAANAASESAKDEGGSGDTPSNIIPISVDIKSDPAPEGWTEEKDKDGNVVMSSGPMTFGDLDAGSSSPIISEVEVVEQVEKKFKVYPDQLQVIDAALDQIKSNAGIDNEGYCLEMMAANALATSDHHFKPGSEFIAFLCATMSKVYGGQFSHDPGGAKAVKISGDVDVTPAAEEDDSEWEIS